MFFSPFQTARRQLISGQGEVFAGQLLTGSRPERQFQKREDEDPAKRHPNLTHT